MRIHKKDSIPAIRTERERVLSIAGVCYDRFVATKKKLFTPLTLLIHSLTGEKTGLYFVDSTPLKVCHNKRIERHKVFEGLAKRGKSTMGCGFLALNSI